MKKFINKNPIKQRMILFLEHIGSNANQFAEKFIALGILGDNTKNYLHSKSGIQSDMLAHISKNYSQLNMNWLLTGEGDMILFQSRDLSENELNLSESIIDENQIKKVTIKERLVQFLDYLRIGQNKFETKVGISIGYVNKVKNSIGSEVIEKIANTYPELNINWLVMEKGSMLLPEGENLSENKSNLAKQNDLEERNSSIDELIKQKVKEAIMENIPAIISAVMEGMNKQMDGQNQVINKQLDMLQEVIRSLADLNTKSENIHENIIKLSRKAQ